MCVYYIWLVVLTILKNMKVNGKDYRFSTMENKKCLKPPTSYIYTVYIKSLAPLRPIPGTRRSKTAYHRGIPIVKNEAYPHEIR